MSPSHRVVITGLGAVSPNGIGVPAFWAACREGRSGIARIAAFDPSEHPIQIAGEVRGLDPVSVLGPHDAKNVSRVVALAAAAADECVTSAGLDRESLSVDERYETGVFLGTGGGAAEYIERMHTIYVEEGPRKMSVYAIAASTPGTLSSEISIRFGVRGPSLVVTTGCTSSTDAIGLALLHLRAGRGRRFLAIGADSPIAPGILDAFHLMKVVTPSWNDEPERASRPFSADRDGFVLAEGAWAVCLETLDAARERNAPILAEVAGYAANCEAHHRVKLDESGEDPARAMQSALADAGLSPAHVQYVSLHGTGTVLNDRVETRALERVFGSRAGSVPGSSLKSMIGHPQGACGAAGVVSTVLAMRDGFLPPTINLDRPDSECRLDYVANRGRPADVDVALCNCIGFGSKNAALVLRRFEP
ncbi:MAG: beta-ketoacyl-[acyl-carrier-protein] synthase family protein [Planctomycetes bacterium]|nr:beta-ketoacyl-[acyl-carrier-protein] synthase family protein [Planctomycetota bacterium]